MRSVIYYCLYIAFKNNENNAIEYTCLNRRIMCKKKPHSYRMRKKSIYNNIVSVQIMILKCINMNELKKNLVHLNRGKIAYYNIINKYL